ncbi:MAG: cob(I)yrinic acid a,c-diamide adenosyltransferase [Thermoanaerobaculales bacterium]|jgi:cob(I)alamin adenosyltransferase|nr:cob(I)yrinic acid a,c-diamide adenosyltransferase [Thermoanaerobaculales bacterium]
MKIYTRTGDAGETSLFSGGRVRKDDARIEAYGTVDEMASFLGLLRCEPLPTEVQRRLEEIQRALFEVGSVLADPARRTAHDEDSWSCAPIEAWIDEMDAELPPLRAFILPGGSRAAALAHVVRTVCRRAERRVNLLQADRGGLPSGLLAYLNRLSDAFFVLARFLNLRDGRAETEWRPRSGASSSEVAG